jgi:hypothetical protein
MPLLIQLRRASLPFPLRLIADHHWFTLFDPATETWHRWEVWQTQNAGGTSWGHVHQNLKPHDQNVGGGPSIIVCEFTGTDANRLAAILTQPESYPHRARYRPFPGPNSNTYVAWILSQANILHPLTRRAIGRRYR